MRKPLSVPAVYSLPGPTPGRIPVQAKQTVREVLGRLPDDCSLQDVIYHLYVVDSIDRGRAEVASGKTVSHEEVAQELRKKWLFGPAG